jgi:DNA-binding NtrC family response regulator
LVNRKEFRQDLYYRLNIVRVVVPPLRERPEDIPPLLDHFMVLYAKQYHRGPLAVSSAVRSVLMSYPWPGNVRELAAWVERLYATGLDAEVLVEMLLVEDEPHRDPAPPTEMSLDQVERRAIVQAMDLSDFNQRKAARMLNVHRATLARKLKKHKLA